MPKSPTIPEALENFVERLVEEKGLTDLEADIKDQVKKDLLDRAEDHVNAAIVEHLPPERLEEFERLLDDGKDAAVQEFCQKHIAGIDEIIAAALLRFRQIYLHG